MEGERKKYELNKYIIQVRSDQVHHIKDHSLGHELTIIKLQDEMLREMFLSNSNTLIDQAILS